MNKWFYKKEVHQKRSTGWNAGGDDVKDDTGRMLSEKKDVKIWTEYSEKFMNVKNQGKAMVTCKRMKVEEKCVKMVTLTRVKLLRCLKILSVGKYQP